jgi:hypothetical protein
VFHVDTNELLGVIRTQIHLISEPGPVAEAVIRKILAAAEEYAKSQAKKDESVSAFSPKSQQAHDVAMMLALPPKYLIDGKAGNLIAGLRGDLEPARDLTRKL